MAAETTRQALPALKAFFDAGVVAGIGDDLAGVCPGFDRDGFIRQAMTGLETLELTGRARQIMQAMADHLPADVPTALGLLLASLGPLPTEAAQAAMAPFRFLPHTLYVAEYGLAHFDLAMQAQYELTKRFTAEFSIRPFLEHDPARTLAVLQQWARDPHPDVRRLVSEGTRPRLPWAPRLRAFQRDPAPVLDLLERLKDDPERYVRRSVANNLNDIGKDHPDVLIEVCRRWSVDAPPGRQWLIRHALRAAVKAGHPGALSLLGYGDPPQLTVLAPTVEPATVGWGGEVRFAASLRSDAAVPQDLLVDVAVHYVKAHGRTRPKVFKLTKLRLLPGQTAIVTDRVRFADLSTRKHYPGDHAIDLRINGVAFPIGACTLMPEAGGT